MPTSCYWDNSPSSNANWGVPNIRGRKLGGDPGGEDDNREVDSRVAVGPVAGNREADNRAGDSRGNGWGGDIRAGCQVVRVTWRAARVGCRVASVLSRGDLRYRGDWAGCQDGPAESKAPPPSPVDWVDYPDGRVASKVPLLTRADWVGSRAAPAEWRGGFEGSRQPHLLDVLKGECSGGLSPTGSCSFHWRGGQPVFPANRFPVVAFHCRFPDVE